MMLMGLSSETFIGVKIVRRAESTAERVVNECANCMGHVGFRRGSDRLPLAFSWHLTVGGLLPQRRFLRLDGTPAPESDGGTLLPEFTSSPLPVMRCRQIGEYLHQTVEFSPGTPELSNIFAAYRYTQYSDRADAHVGEYYSVCPRVPTRRYVEDIWVHESMPLILEPSSGLYFPGSRVMGGHPRSREFDKISALPPPTNLGRGIGGASLEGHAGHAGLISHMFTQLGWNPAEFRGFRVLVHQPLWNLEYVTHFPSAEHAGTLGGER